MIQRAHIRSGFKYEARSSFKVRIYFKQQLLFIGKFKHIRKQGGVKIAEIRKWKQNGSYFPS